MGWELTADMSLLNTVGEYDDKYSISIAINNKLEVITEA